MKRTKANTSLKRTIKFLATNTHPQITKLILQKANTDVIKSISNAALNAYKGNIKISPINRAKFAKHRKVFEALLNRHVPITKKRKLLVNQKGGFAFAPLIPILLSTVISAIGSAFLNKGG